MNKNFQIGVVGGCGHIGLPLSLILAKKYKVTIIDPSKNKELISKKQSPFKDKGIDKYLNDQTVQNNLDYIDSINQSKLKYDAIVITLGTPVDEWSNPNIDDISKICCETKKFLKKMQC
jgi:UDP-N-acetyl-D-mannosaminuronic acid dehydrogenase